jgi:hypothetical protein
MKTILLACLIVISLAALAQAQYYRPYYSGGWGGSYTPYYGGWNSYRPYYGGWGRW